MKQYVTTPIYYVNDAPHIGHAYTSVMADILSRTFAEVSGKENSYFLTGTDEHGQKIERSAEKSGKNPQEFCDEVSAKFLNMCKDFELFNNDFIRTTEGRHKNGVIQFWQKLEQNGWIYKGNYAGWYCVRDEAFYSEEELINGKAPTGAEVEWQEEESYFFKLSAFTEVLTQLYSALPGFVFPLKRLNEVKAFVSGGLQDLSISRTSFKWGIEVSNDKSHVIYVWLDALTNYITALGYPNGKKYSEFWLSRISTKIHVIGKDILRFHAIFWPAFLIAERYKIGKININEVIEFFKPFCIAAHGWWQNEGQKISKSLGNAINPYDLIAEFGLDKVRYFFVREMKFGEDGNYTKARFLEVTNADLANNIGNLTQRVMSFIFQNCDGRLPRYTMQTAYWESTESDLRTGDLTKELPLMLNNFYREIQSLNFNFAVQEILLKLASTANEVMQIAAPWALKKEGKIEEMNNVLFELSLCIYYIYKMLLPVVPSSAKKGLDIFNNILPKSGNIINMPQPIFLRLK